MGLICYSLHKLVALFPIQVIPKLNLMFLMSHEKILKQTSRAPHVCYNLLESQVLWLLFCCYFPFYLCIGFFLPVYWFRVFLCCSILNDNIIKRSTFIFILIFCASACLHAWTYTMCMQVPEGVRRECWILWNWGHRWCELSCRC